MSVLDGHRGPPGLAGLGRGGRVGGPVQHRDGGGRDGRAGQLARVRRDHGCAQLKLQRLIN